VIICKSGLAGHAMIWMLRGVGTVSTNTETAVVKKPSAYLFFSLVVNQKIHQFPSVGFVEWTRSWSEHFINYR